MSFSPEQSGFLLNLSRAVIRHALGAREFPLPSSNDPALNQPAGCFVTLHRLAEHELRGCIGRLTSPDALIQTVIEMSQAVLDDPRFQHDPVSLMELEDLELELSILSPPEPAANPLDFDLLNDGIFLDVDHQRGCFLPQVARETGWTKQQLLDRLCSEKMGLSPYAWKTADAKLSRFTVTILGPEPFVR